MRATVTVWLTWLVLMASANLGTPLYAVYAKRFHFSSLVLTAIFATYALVLVPALILFGRLSDRFGRRPVILTGLTAAAVGLVLFALATGTAWLFAGRACQGLAVGMIGGAATAALVELDPDGDRRRAALFAGLAQAGGSAAGPLVAGVLAQWAPDPLRLCFYAGIGATVLSAAATLTLPASGAGGDPWRIQWPRVPRALLGRFSLVSVTAGVVWAAVALYLSIVPSYVSRRFHTHDLALLAAIASAALLASCAAQIVSRVRESSERRDQIVGLLLLAVGLLGLVLVSSLHSLGILVVGAVVTGIGHGLGFLDAQQEVNELAPAARRGEVTSAFIAVVYFCVAAAVVGAGLFGVHPVALALVAVALGTAAWQARVAWNAWLPRWRSGSSPRSRRSEPERSRSSSRRRSSGRRPARSR
ncbi:MAG: MFS transporter [Actinobacteria bacterium]|nr:MFS transporter [Actinomycetota bacterium]